MKRRAKVYHRAMQTDSSATWLERVRIVLVGTQHPGNIGSAARAMKTMGLTRLWLVAPERFPHVEAWALAAGADDILAAAEVIDEVPAAVADCRLVLGCTARDRRIAMPQLDPPAAARRLREEGKQGEIALLFGPERTGLDNAALQLCHAAVHIPANPGYSSLNLAAAVQVLCYELRMAMLADAAPSPAPVIARDQAPATHAQMEGFYAQLADTLDAIDFHKGRSPDAAMRKLRRLYARAQPDEREVRLLRGILADSQRMARLAREREG